MSSLIVNNFPTSSKFIYKATCDDTSSTTESIPATTIENTPSTTPENPLTTAPENAPSATASPANASGPANIEKLKLVKFQKIYQG